MLRHPRCGTSTNEQTDGAAAHGDGRTDGCRFVICALQVLKCRTVEDQYSDRDQRRWNRRPRSTWAQGPSGALPCGVRAAEPGLSMRAGACPRRMQHVCAPGWWPPRPWPSEALRSTRRGPVWASQPGDSGTYGGDRGSDLLLRVGCALGCDGERPGATESGRAGLTPGPGKIDAHLLYELIPRLCARRL